MEMFAVSQDNRHTYKPCQSCKEKNQLRRNMNDHVPILVLLMKSMAKQNVTGK